MGVQAAPTCIHAAECRPPDLRARRVLSDMIWSINASSHACSAELSKPTLWRTYKQQQLTALLPDVGLITMHGELELHQGI